MIAENEQLESPPEEMNPQTPNLMLYKAKLAQKKLKAQDLVGWVKKNGVCKAEKFSYNYAAAADVIAAARDALQEAGLAIVIRNPKVTRTVLIPPQKCQGQYGEYEKPGLYLYTLVIDLGFVDAETGYEEVSRYTGEGSDTGDKGIPKANTNTLKYFLIQQLLIPTGDDPEADPSPEGKEPRPPYKGKRSGQDFYGSQNRRPVGADHSEELPPAEPPIEDQIADGLLGPQAELPPADKQPSEADSDSALPPYNEKSQKIMDALYDYYKAKINDMEDMAFNAFKLRAKVFGLKGKWPETATGATVIKGKIRPEEVADKVVG